jgi:hypothetical protein
LVETLLALRHVVPTPMRAASAGSAVAQALEAK